MDTNIDTNKYTHGGTKRCALQPTSMSFVLGLAPRRKCTTNGTQLSRRLWERRGMDRDHNITGQSFPLFARREKFLTPTVWAFFPHPDGSATWISNKFDTFETWSRNLNIWFSFVNEYVFLEMGMFFGECVCFLENVYVFWRMGMFFWKMGMFFWKMGMLFWKMGMFFWKMSMFFLENEYVFFEKWVCFFWKMGMFFLENKYVFLQKWVYFFFFFRQLFFFWKMGSTLQVCFWKMGMFSFYRKRECFLFIENGNVFFL